MGRNRERGGLQVVNKLIYTDDTATMAEGREELKSLLMKVKEESEKSGLKLSMNLEPIIQNEVKPEREK